jgi:predicted CopG family antitoxin
MIPKSYIERNQNLSQYAQRLWWCITTSSSEMVDFTEQLVFNDKFFPHPANIIAYEIDNDVYKEKYVTIIKRFHKPVSCLQVYDDWICKLYTTKRDGIDMFRIWHPSQSEISRRTINDDLDEAFEGQRNELWSFKDVIYRCFTDDYGNALQLQ